MKKIITIILALVFCFAFGLTAFAEEGEENINTSQPRLMLYDYSVSEEYIVAGKEAEITLYFKNYSSTESLENIKITLAEENGEISFDKTGSVYVDKIDKNSAYVLKQKVKVNKNAAAGEHVITVNAEYENSDSEAFSSAENVKISVKQPSALDYSGISLPASVTVGEAIPLEMSFMNTSKADIKNIKVVFSINGISEAKVFAGSAAAGETVAASAVLNAKNKPLSARGKAVISYTDSLGDNKKIVVKLYTKIKAKSKKKQPAEEITDSSQARLMVTDYYLDAESLKPGKESELKVTLKNYSSTKALRNIKLSLTEESGDIKPVGTGTQFVSSINAGASYTWTVKLTAAKTAAIGEHAVTISSEYEDKYYTAYSGTDVLRLNVKQKTGLDYSGVQLPAKVVEGDTITLDMSFMNTGKCKIRNLKIDFDIPNLESGGTTFVGEIEAGESGAGSANLRATNTLGETKGTITISYEDEFGEEYTKTVDIATIIEKKVETKTDEEEKDEKKNPQWWAFLLGGTALGGGIGCAIPLSISARKQRKEDELRL